jgi:hypothetical protein
LSRVIAKFFASTFSANASTSLTGSPLAAVIEGFESHFLKPSFAVSSWLARESLDELLPFAKIVIVSPE